MPYDPNDFTRPKEWHEEINPFSAANYQNAPVQSSFVATTPTLPQYGYLANVADAYNGQGNARAQQQALVDMLRNRALGRGTSVAQALLQQQTDRLQQQQAGMVASQRGMNPALQRRLIMQQAANAQQQMAGQGAVLRAQEILAAQNALGQQLGTMRGQDLSLYGAAGGLGQAQNALTSQNYMGAQEINAQIDAQNRQAVQDWIDRDLKARQAQAQVNRDVASGLFNAAATIPKLLKGGDGGGGALAAGANAPGAVAAGAGEAAGEAAGAALLMSGGGMVPGYNCGGYATRLMTDGGMIPGRAKMPGDHPANDTVPANLSPGEGVIPRSIMQSPDAPIMAAHFVAMLKSRGSGRSPAMRLMGGGSR